CFAWWVRFNINKIKLHHEATEAESILQNSRYLYRHPIASTILLLAGFTSLLAIQYPILFSEIAWITTVVTATFIISKQVPQHLLSRWIVLVVLLVLY